MIFKRRAALGVMGRVKSWVAPAKGWRRGFAYIGRRVQRLPDTPHRIALGFACGVMASFTPLFGLHFVVAALLALLVRGNVLASALGTFLGNPITFPFIAGAALGCGALITGESEHLRAFTPAMVFDDFELFLKAVFLPYLIGGVGPGLLTSSAIYALVRPVIAAYQTRRRSKLAAAAKAKVEAHLRARGGHDRGPRERTTG
jgi:uncharacterized protein (DUF2062 family)